MDSLKKEPIKESDLPSTSKGTIYERIMNKIVRFLSTTTSHGLPRIVESKKVYQKVIWSVCLIISIGLCSFTVAQAIIEYFSFEVITKIRVVSHDEILFPQVSICNQNTFITKEAEEFLRNSNSRYPYLLPNHPDFNVTLKKSFAYNLDDILFDCSYRFLPCDSSWFLWYYDPNYGNCYYFNWLNTTKYRTVGREGDGFYFELFIGPSDFYRNYIRQQKFSGNFFFYTNR